MLGRKEMSLTDGASGSSRAYLRAKPARPEFIRDTNTRIIIQLHSKHMSKTESNEGLN